MRGDNFFFTVFHVLERKEERKYPQNVIFYLFKKNILIIKHYSHKSKYRLKIKAKGDLKHVAAVKIRLMESVLRRLEEYFIFYNFSIVTFDLHYY